MKYGRLDTEGPLQCPPEGALPAAAAPFEDGSPDAASHLRNVFYRMVRARPRPHPNNNNGDTNSDSDIDYDPPDISVIVWQLVQSLAT